MEEFAVKLGRARGLLDAEGLAALVLVSEGNCAWLGCGPDDGVDLASARGGRSRVWVDAEAGVAALIVTRAGVYLWGENIEFPRLTRDEFTGIPVESLVQDWRSSSLGRAVAQVAPAGGGPIGYDLPTPDLLQVPNARFCGPQVTALRASLTPRELERYRWLCRKAAVAVRELCEVVRPGWTEVAINAEVQARLAASGIAHAVPIVTCDDRMFVDRHGLYGDAKLQRYLMVVLCARKWGLTACLTRLTHFGPLPALLQARHAAARRIARKLNEATQPGARLADLFNRVLMPAYAAEGYAHEVALHHQGGSTGYSGRDVRVTAESAGSVQPSQAFAWNPSITGTKVEDTVWVGPHGPEILTREPAWPQDASGDAAVWVR